jgi:hypothetical protein
MKKKALFAVLCVQFLCVSAIFCQTAVIREISGTVELKQAEQTSFVQAKVGDEIAQNTIVSTGFRSTALIEVGSTMITVRPLTRLSFAEIRSASGTETINVGLQVGRVKVDVNPPSGTKTSMSVRGPNATASVRGTSFEFDTKNLSVESGIVAFRGNRGSVMLIPSGSSSDITSNDTAEDPIKTDALDLVPKTTVSVIFGGNDESSSDSFNNSSNSLPSDLLADTPVDVIITLNFD